MDSKDEVDELGSFLKTNDADGVKSIHIFFRTILMRVLKYQLTLLLMSGFPMGSMLS